MTQYSKDRGIMDKEQEDPEVKNEWGDAEDVDSVPRRRVRLSYRNSPQNSNTPWMWIAVIFLVAVAMVASRGCSSSMENVVRLFMQDVPQQNNADASLHVP